ncbi:hypothetical protein ACKN8S_04650 [Limosilactobacillus reuteri]|uniref:hypothetical protein n=1 Tax=Limosilactobacillus reuteri TaxID=1598 RepID=UPI0039BEF5E1
MGEPNNLKYLEKTSPQALIDVLNSDLEQTAKRYNSFCQLINDRLAIHNSLHYNHSPIDPGFNRRTRLGLIKNIRNLNQAFDRLASLLNQSPFRKVDKGQIIPYDFTAWIDVGIKLTKEQINDYIKQVENVLKELFDFKTKYRLND